MDFGDVVGGRYRLERAAAKGGMGSVFKATDLVDLSPCAVKLVHDEAGAGAEAARRFGREVEALRKIEHPAVVRYIDHGVVDDESPFLVMEWVEGETLRRALRSGPPPLADALVALERLVDALAAIHAAGVVHRDIKPQNLMLPNGELGAVCIVDFGIARLESAVSFVDLTVAGFRLGTPGFMAPEQMVSARDVDGRADVFSLGCVAFELFTGRRAFEGRDDLARLARVVIGPPPRVRGVRPSVPLPIDELVARMLTRDPAGRPEAGPELLAEIAELRERYGEARISAVPTPAVSFAVAVDSIEEEEASLPVEQDEVSLATATITRARGELVDREAELERLVRETDAPGRIVALWGAPGIGKSRLLREVAAARAALFVDLRTARDLASVLFAVARRLRIARVDPAHRQVAYALRARGRALLVLDGADGVLSVLGPLLAAWMKDAPDATILVSARTRPVFADAEIELGPLPTAADRGLSPAATLLATRVRERGLAHVARDDASLNALAALLGGNPLSIEVAAATLEAARSEPGAVAGLTQRLSGSRALEDALAAAWDSLTPDEQDGLERLAMFSSDIEIDEATKLLGEHQAAALLEALRERSLCAPGERESTVSLSSAVRDFVRARGGGELAEAHGVYVVELGERLVERVERGGDPEAFERLSMRTEDLLGLADGDDERAARAIAALDPVLVGRVPASQHLDLLERGIALVAPSDGTAALDRARERLHARLVLARGRVLALMGRLAEAQADLSAARAFARTTSDGELEAAALMEFAVLAHATGDVESGERCCRAVLALGARVAGARRVSRAVGNLGGLAHDAGRFDEAYGRYVEAIALAESARDDRLLGVFLANLAALDADRGRPRIARARLLRAMVALTRLNEHRLVALTRANLAMVDLELGETQSARDGLVRASEALQQLGDERSEALARMRLAAAEALLGDADAGRRAIVRALVLAAKDERLSAAAEVFEAFLHLARGDLAAARAARDRAFTPLSTGRALATSSDDIRAAIRVLAPRLA